MFSSSVRPIDLTGLPFIAGSLRTFVMCDWKKNREGLPAYSDKHRRRASARQARSRAKLAWFRASAFAPRQMHAASRPCI
jgi:hypothetical protein